MKLSHEEIARQAADRSHLEPDPVLCKDGEFVCTACGEFEKVDPDWGLPWEWMAKHRRCGR